MHLLTPLQPPNVLPVTIQLILQTSTPICFTNQQSHLLKWMIFHNTLCYNLSTWALVLLLVMLAKRWQLILMILCHFLSSFMSIIRPIVSYDFNNKPTFTMLCHHGQWILSSSTYTHLIKVWNLCIGISRRVLVLGTPIPEIIGHSILVVLEISGYLDVLTMVLNICKFWYIDNIISICEVLIWY